MSACLPTIWQGICGEILSAYHQPCIHYSEPYIRKALYSHQCHSYMVFTLITFTQPLMDVDKTPHKHAHGNTEVTSTSYISPQE